MALGTALGLGLAFGSGVSRAEGDGGRVASLSASELLPFSTRRAHFLLREADGKTREVTWSRRAFAEGGDRWHIEVPGLQAELLERGKDGRVQVLTQWDYRKGHRIEYDPPALLLPSRLEPGVESRSESRVVVYDLGGAKTASGTCVHRVRLVGESTIETAAGQFAVVRVDLERAVDILIADARVTIELAFVPGRGRVLERIVERVRFFGFGGGRELRVLELLAEGDPAGA
jgi:hypothetical protein